MKFIVPVMVIIGIIVSVIYYINLYQVNQSCDGHVVKNIWDWPVCVH